MPTENEIIRSRSNPLVKRFREVGAGKDREFFLLEGTRFLEAALKADIEIEAALFDPKVQRQERAGNLLQAIQRAGCPVHGAEDQVIRAISEVETPQGIVCIAKKPSASMQQIMDREKNPFLLVLAGISDPGNLGSLLRSADGAGVSGALILEGSVSLFNSKTIRATMGSVFQIPAAERVVADDLLEEIQRRQISLVISDADQGVDYRELVCQGGIALCLGSEAQGVPDSLRKKASAVIRIPLREGVESLNVAAAGAILLFEVASKRRTT